MKCIRTTLAAAALLCAAASHAGDGLPDQGFGEIGGVTLRTFAVDDHRQDAIAAMLTTAQHGLLVVGTTGAPQRTAFTLLRLDEDGLPVATFGTQGLVVSKPPQETRNFHATSAALDSAQRVLVAGYVEVDPGQPEGDRNVMVCRFLENGSLDPSFGAGTLPYAGCGEFGFDLGGNLWDVALDVAIDTQGRILLAGYSSRVVNYLSGLEMRLTVDGALDPKFFGYDFVGDGWGVYPPADFDAATGSLSFPRVVPMDDGRIAYAVEVAPDPGIPSEQSKNELTVVTSGQDGFLDVSSTIFRFSPQAPGRNRITAMAVVGERIVVAGSGEFGPERNLAGLAAFDRQSLDIDTTFGNGGIFRSALCGACLDSRIDAMAIRADGKIVIAATLFSDKHRSIVARLVPNAASLDTSFGVAGITTLELQPGSDDEAARAVALQADQPVIAAHVINAQDTAFAVARVTGNRIFRDGLEE